MLMIHSLLPSFLIYMALDFVMMRAGLSLLPYCDFKWIQIANWRETYIGPDFPNEDAAHVETSLIRKHGETAVGESPVQNPRIQSNLSPASTVWASRKTTPYRSCSRSSAGLMPQSGHRCRQVQGDPKSGTVISTRMISSCHALSSSLADARNQISLPAYSFIFLKKI
jgi:hypothetical protein